MPEIISFGSHTRKISAFKLILFEIANLSSFTKLVILTAIILALVTPFIIKDGESLISNAAPVEVKLGSALPANCHLAVDFTSCEHQSSCQPTPAVVCDQQH